MSRRLKPARLLPGVLFLAQTLIGLRVLVRMVRTAGGHTIPASKRSELPEMISVIVPVLNEAERLGSCLEGLTTQGAAVREILVVDGGSTDGTQTLTTEFATSDRRVRLIDASPVPSDWNGKAWGLQVGLDASSEESAWLLCVDADTVPAPALAASLLDFARDHELRAVSVATRQLISSPGEGLVHPSMLTTLVYRYGIPGNTYTSVNMAQANGQCFFVSRDLMLQIGGYSAVRHTVCEDIALARKIVGAGETIGFYESDDLISVRMYRNGRETWREWPRSLPMRDHYEGPGWITGLAEVATVQALPLPLLVTSVLSAGHLVPRRLAQLNFILFVMRLGVLAGTRRAYQQPPSTYWLSPLADVPVAIKLIVSSFRRNFIWRGRQVERGER